MFVHSREEPALKSFVSKGVVNLCLGLVLLAALAACSDEPGLPDFTQLVEQSSPAIVNISGRGEAEREQQEPSWFDWFRQFEPEQEPPAESKPRDSLGSGFILSSDGEILTNHHVIDGAKEITVTLADHRQYQAAVIGRDKASDLALLKIDAKALPVLRWGSSKDLKVGAWVLAIGSPFGFEHTATAGIVSGKRRALASEQYVPFLQTDVAINPGNSGGPLFNLDGEVVGVNSQIFSRTGGYMGLSFAIPSDTAKQVVQQLRKHGRVRRAWLGVVIQQVDAELAESFGLEHAKGALVSQVEVDGPADKAGLQAGDIILRLDDEDILESRNLPPLVGQRAPGDKVRLRILRDGRPIDYRIKLAQLPDAQPASSDWTGLELAALSSRQAARMNVDGGLLVKAVEPGSAAADAGLQPADVILSAAGQSLGNVDAFKAWAAQVDAGASVPMLVLRGERNLFMAMKRP